MITSREKVIERIKTVEAGKADYLRFMEASTDRDFAKLPFTKEQIIQYVSHQTSNLLKLRKRLNITDKEIVTTRVISVEAVR